MTQSRSIDVSRTAKAIVNAINGTGNFEEEFSSGLINFDNNHTLQEDFSQLRPPSKPPKGISITYGETEGLQAIVRAYQNLQVATDKQVFSEEIANTLQKFAEHYRIDGRGPGYAHFLLHGLVQPTAEQVAQKLLENALILIESAAAQHEFLLQQPPQCRLPGFHFSIERGCADDYDGVAFELLSNRDSQSGTSQYRLAHVGFLLSPSRAQATVITIQGRKIYYKKPQLPDTDDPLKMKEYEKLLHNYRECAEEGRNFARAAAFLGVDPRAYTLSCVIERLFEQGYQEIRGITPSEHVMCIGKHKGFTGRYEHIFTQAGMLKKDNVYYSIERL